MTKKNIFIIIFVLALGGLSLYINRDRFGGQPIQLSHRLLRSRPGAGTAAAEPIIFLLDREVELTSLKVISLTALETNKNAIPIWHLVSDSTSFHLKEFYYGRRIEGMEPALKGSQPSPLQPGISYRVLIEAGHKKAQDDFNL